MNEETGAQGPRRVTAPWLRDARRDGRRICMITAYDAPSARLADAAGVDAILVGDSIGRNALGYPDELPVTMDDMVRATAAVRRGAQRALVITDMPFGSYQAGEDEAVANAIRLVKEGGAHAVKLEGAGRTLSIVERIVGLGVPVVGHVGFTPQSTNAMGGAHVQGKTRETAQAILDAARALEAAGVFSIVLELIPAPLARTITNSITVPTIGIGSGPHCDGQVQIWHDVLGLGGGKVYRHVRRYADVGAIIREAVSSYVLDVQGGQFPTREHSVSMDLDELAMLDQEPDFDKQREDIEGVAR
ncbi:MAG TPA: 3-methyl-2-oxobutanoate hydroxymethyltransferase [Armatimonadota bacterium]|jgi:3-methyl-2-oxobutanoate hydroxymethyltransferase